MSDIVNGEIVPAMSGFQVLAWAAAAFAVAWVVRRARRLI
jgi:hypothetical protein